MTAGAERGPATLERLEAEMTGIKGMLAEWVWVWKAVCWVTEQAAAGSCNLCQAAPHLAGLIY